MKIGHKVVEMLTDAEIIHDTCDDYGEPSYRKQNEQGFIIFGDLWCHQKDCNFEETYPDGNKKLHSVEVHYPRLFKKMEEQVVEFHWYDEWIVDYNHNKAYRTQPDCYQWQPSILWTDGDFLTPDDDIEMWIEAVVNNPHKALPKHIWSDSDLEEKGFTEYQCGYESGWHPGQTDDPVKISKLIQEQYGKDKVDILYKLSYVSQFDLGFCVLIKEKEQDEVHN